jgi:hypothetical protein
MTMPSFEDYEYEVTLEPETVLRSVIASLKPPVNSAEGWLTLMNHPESPLSVEELNEKCLANIRFMKLVLAKAMEYLDKRESDS